MNAAVHHRSSPRERELPRALIASFITTTVLHAASSRSPPSSLPAAASHESKESAWSGFAAFCKARVAELEKLSGEQAEHKLHRWYRRARIWQRFPGLYETLHNRARGTWDNDMWAAYLTYRARLTPLPWDPTVGDVGEDKRKAILEDVATRSGISAETIAGAIGGKAKK